MTVTILLSPGETRLDWVLSSQLRPTSREPRYPSPPYLHQFQISIHFHGHLAISSELLNT